jgi:uncharacterized cupin superfamily protein
MKGIVHWDEASTRRVEVGPLAATWTNLGEAAGTITTGLRRIQIDAGGRSTPAHVHGAEEEIFYVLGGSGLSWQDGVTYEVAAGDCLAHLPKAQAHTLVAGVDGLDVLAYSNRLPSDGAYLPRTHVAWLGATWVRAGEQDHPFKQEVLAGELVLPPPTPERPGRIAALADVHEEVEVRGSYGVTSRDLATAAGSRSLGLQHVHVHPGKLSCPAHCHSAEEEIFVVLAGAGEAVIGDEAVAVGPGHVIARPAGSRVAHMFRAAVDPVGLTYLAMGQRDTRDISYYPRTNKVFFRGVGLLTRLEPVGYWDGEE